MIQRWRVDCRKERGPWKTLLTEAYDTQAEAEAAKDRYQASGEWDMVEVTPGEERCTDGRRLVAMGKEGPCL